MGNFGQSCTTVCHDSQLNCSAHLLKDIPSDDQFQESFFQQLGVNCKQNIPFFDASVPDVIIEADGGYTCYIGNPHEFDCSKIRDGSATATTRRICHCYNRSATETLATPANTSNTHSFCDYSV
jgi:hypothetical protein